VYHFYYTGGAYYKSDGTHITAGLPLGPTDLTLVYGDTDGAGWTFDAVLGPTGDPRVLVQIDDGDAGTTNIIREFRYVAGAWVGVDVIPDTGGVWVANISPGAVYDHTNPNTIYGCVKVAGTWEVWRYRTTDNGASWIGAAVTTSSPSNNLTPSAVFDHEGAMPAVWFYGTYTSYTNYSTGVKGLLT